MKVLITGGHGKLGSEVAKLYPDALVPTHKELDITDWQSVSDYFSNFQIDLVIHLAALITIPACEKNKELAWNTNVEGTKNLSLALSVNSLNGLLVYMSTPCIFDGKNAPYHEYSRPYPQNFYGFTKYLGEREVKKRQDHLIIRSNFVAYEPWPHPKAFSDRYSNYLFAHDLAKGIKETIDGVLYDSDRRNRTYHVVGDKKLSMYELAKLCPNSNNVEPFTLKEYYEANPDADKLTENMCLETINHWKKFELTVKAGVTK